MKTFLHPKFSGRGRTVYRLMVAGTLFDTAYDSADSAKEQLRFIMAELNCGCGAPKLNCQIVCDGCRNLPIREIWSIVPCTE